MDFTYGNFGDLGLVEYYIANLPMDTDGTLYVATQLQATFDELGWDQEADLWYEIVELLGEQ